MKIVVAPDSFKGSLSAAAAARAIALGIKRGCRRAKVIEVPIADGGEGTVDALVSATRGRTVTAAVSDPLGRRITARYGLLGNGRTTVIEMAAASGLPLLGPSERNPMRTTTFGTGQLILDAAKKGAREIIIGIGGSATVDGGVGMARALGIRFLDTGGRELDGGGAVLEEIRHIDATGLHPAVRRMKITAACDVTNPLTGPEGAASVYGPQKGATAEMVTALDNGLRNLAGRIRTDLGTDVEFVKGSGAAGGLGAGLMAFLGAKLKRGVDIVLEAVDLGAKLNSADVVFTGEGRVDGQSVYGKAVSGVALLAKKQRVPCIVLAGSVGEGGETLYRRGVTAVLSIARGPAEEQALMANAADLLKSAACEAMRVFVAGSGVRRQGGSARTPRKARRTAAR